MPKITTLIFKGTYKVIKYLQIEIEMHSFELLYKETIVGISDFFKHNYPLTMCIK